MEYITNTIINRINTIQMRTIKFRGLSKKTNNWVYGAYFKASEELNEEFIIDNCSYSSKLEGFSGHEIKRKSAGQFTGLTDKNGKEIYENDILLHTETQDMGVIIYDSNRCYFNVTDNYPDTLYNCDMLNEPGSGWMDYEIEVIGNIHEHSDLLKQQ